MQFLYPIYLWAFLLVLIPIMIHLFQLRKYKLIYFSSLKFLKQLEIEQKRRSRLREILLLITRILLISMLVMAFAHPYFPGDSKISAEHKIVGLYIDNSLSMENEAEGMSLFDHAKKAAIKMAGSYPPETRFYLLHNEDIFNSRFPIESKEVVSSIEMIRPSSTSSNLSIILERFNEITGINGDLANPTLHIFSDLQLSFISSARTIKNPDYSVIINLLPDGITNNIYIDSCWINSPVQNPEKRHTIHARINNASDQDLNRFPVHLKIMDSLVAQETVSAGSFGTADIEFSYNSDAKGWQRGSIEIRDYPISFDNRFHFAYYISDKIPVLQIFSQNENLYLRTLFESDSYFDYSYSESGSIPYQDLNKFKLIVLNSVTEFSSRLSVLLDEYVKRGGSLIILPPEDGNFKNLNLLTQMFDSPVFRSMVDKESEARIPENMESFYDRITMNPEQQVEWPKFLKYYKLAGNLSDSEIILKNEIGQPMIARNSFGNGFVTLCASPLTDNYTNFHVHPLFIPLLYYLANTGMDAQDLYYRIGHQSPVSLEVKNAPEKGPSRIIETNGSYDVIPQQFWDPVTGRLMLYLGNYNGSAGFLELIRNNNTEAIIAMNYSMAESQIEKPSINEIESILQESGLNSFSMKENTEDFVSTDKIKIQGRTFPLIRILLLLALFLLLIESLIHRFKS